MEEINVKCYRCGKTQKVNRTDKTFKCSFCQEEILTDRASKYNKKFLEVTEIEIKRTNVERINELNLLIDKAQFYIEQGDYDSAKEELNKALEINDSDYRIYMCYVAIETENYTDYENVSHKEYMEKAISVASEYEKQIIKKTYMAYYNKTKLSEDELKDYDEVKRDTAFSKLEDYLKSYIPRHFANEKRVKLFLTLSIIGGALFLTTLIVGIFINNPYLYVACCLLLAISFAFFRAYFSFKNKADLFNALLDMFDNYSKFNFNLKEDYQIIDLMQSLALNFINKESEFSMSKNTYALVEKMITSGDKVALSFVRQYKAFYKESPIE